MLYLIALLLIGYLLIKTKIGHKLLRKIAESSMKIIFIVVILGVIGYLVLNIIFWILNNPFKSLAIAAAIFAVFIVIGTIAEQQEKKFHAQKVAEWKSRPYDNMTDFDIEKMLAPVAEKFEQTDTNNVTFSSGFPFGRITYFINFFQHDLENEDPLYFSPVRSTNRDELKEYGTALTTAGLYVSKQKTKTNKDGSSLSTDVFVPFSGMVFSKLTDSELTVFYEEYKNTKRIKKTDTTVPLKDINEMCEMIISSGVSRAIAEQNVYDYVAVADEKESEFFDRNNADGINKGIATAGVASSIPSINKVFDETGYNMNQRQGHGAAAEYANTTIDRITGDFRAEHMGSNNETNGPDRSTHRLFQEKTLIQSKYCKMYDDNIKNPTAKSNKIINEAFTDHDYSPDMKIEVPRDYYNQCVKDLQTRIDSGEFEYKGIKKGDRAENYLRKGYFTYEQSFKVATAGTIEGLAIDTMQGIVCSTGAGSITALITFANCMWNGMEAKDAAVKSLETGAKVMGKSTAIFVISMQISRKNLVNIFAKEGAKNATVINPLYTVSTNLAKKISTSSVAKSQLGKKIGLNNVTGKTITSGTVAFAVTFGPDIARALVGRISFKQLMKNSAVGASGIAGAAIGQTIIPIPVVGGMIGGAVAGFVAKKTLDMFIEDDAVEMFAILKEEFMDIIPLAGLNSDEFDEVVSMTLAHKKLESKLREMFAYGDSREYARENIVGEAVQYVYSKRNVITEEMYDNAFALLAAE